MDYAAVKARLVVHATTAGAAITEDPVLDVVDAFALPKGRCVRVYYGGEAEPVRMGGMRVLNGEMVAEVTMIALFLPVAVNDEMVAGKIDAQLYTFKDALRTAVLGDSTLNAEGTDLQLGYLTPNIVEYGNTRYLMGLWECTVDYNEYALSP